MPGPGFATGPFLITLFGAAWWIGGACFSVRSALRQGRTVQLFGLDSRPGSTLLLVSGAGPLAAVLGGLFVGSWTGAMRPLGILTPLAIVLVAAWLASGAALALLLEGRGAWAGARGSARRPRARSRR